MTPTPDILGFRAAQRRLRQEMGSTATFKVPVEPVWPMGTPLDPQTQRPYDPTVEPDSGGDFTLVEKVVGLVFRPIKVNVEDPVGDDVHGGIRHGESIAMSVEVEDYEDVRLATQVNLAGTEYKVTSIITDPGTDDRYIVFAEAR